MAPLWILLQIDFLPASLLLIFTNTHTEQGRLNEADISRLIIGLQLETILLVNRWLDNRQLGLYKGETQMGWV